MNARHPITQIASLELPVCDSTKGLLNAEIITQAAAKHFNLPYIRIDPLKVDVAAVTDLVSQAYATRYQILPLKITANSVMVATAEPNIEEWINDIKPIVNRDARTSYG